MRLRKIPHTYTIISVVILICAALSWIIPAGEYAREVRVVNGTERTVIVDHSFHAVEQSPQSWQVFGVLLDGFEKQAGIIAFLLIIGGAFQVMNSSRAIDAGIFSFLRAAGRFERYGLLRWLGVNNMVISLVIVLFSLFGAVFGMSEETLAFVIIIIPLAISMGYDSITGLCMVYVAAHVGFSGAILNPFTIGIAQGLSDLPLFSGLGYRLFCWVVLTALLIAFVLRYAARIKRDPRLSPMYEADAYWRERHESAGGEVVAVATGRSARVVYGLILLALVLFSIRYPMSSFAVGQEMAHFPAVPLFTALYALIEPAFHPEPVGLYDRLPDYRGDGTWLVPDRDLGHFPGDGHLVRFRERGECGWGDRPVPDRREGYAFGGVGGRTGRRYHPDLAGWPDY